MNHRFTFSKEKFPKEWRKGGLETEWPWRIFNIPFGSLVVVRKCPKRK